MEGAKIPSTSSLNGEIALVSIDMATPPDTGRRSRLNIPAHIPHAIANPLNIEFGHAFFLELKWKQTYETPQISQKEFMSTNCSHISFSRSSLLHKVLYQPLADSPHHL